MLESAMNWRDALAALALIVTAAPASAQLGEVGIETRWIFQTDAAHAGSTARAALQVTLEEKYHVNANKPLEDFLIPTVLTVTPPEGITVAGIVYPVPLRIQPSFSDVPMAVFEQDFAIGVALAIGADLPPGRYPLTARLEYQACNDQQCLAPATREIQAELLVVAASAAVTDSGDPVFEEIDFSSAGGAPPTPPTTKPVIVPAIDADFDIMAALDDFTILGTAGGYMDGEDFIAFIDAAERGEVQASWYEGKGPIAILVLIILGGMALNLTPCVLPLIPINLAIIGAGAQAGSRSRGFALGGTYGLAMAAVYGGLGLIVVLAGTAFGAINSTIWFNVGIAVLFIALGLAMLDVFAIDFSKWQGKIDLAGGGKKGTFALAFGMGAVAALLAGACVAPVVIQVIVYSADQYERGTKLALTLPFFLGLGMALPWPFAGAGLSFLPKPGAWMVRVKQAMGAFILLFAGYYGYLAWEIFDSRRVDPALVNESVQEQLEGGWFASARDGLAQAKAEDKLVLIDMWASWCKNCYAMDRTTLQDDAVQARLEDFVKIKYQAETIDEPPASEVLGLFGGIGLPHYAVLRPKSAENTAP